jgi:hypothetical protein
MSAELPTPNDDLLTALAARVADQGGPTAFDLERVFEVYEHPQVRITNRQILAGMTDFGRVAEDVRVEAISTYPGDEQKRERREFMLAAMAGCIGGRAGIEKELLLEVYINSREFRRITFGAYQQWTFLPPDEQKGGA